MQAPLLISKKILFPVAIFGLVFSFITLTFDVAPLGLPSEAGAFLTYLAVLCSFATVLILIVDVFKNNLHARYLWTLAFLLTGCFAGLYYLLNREKLVTQP